MVSVSLMKTRQTTGFEFIKRITESTACSCYLISDIFDIYRNNILCVGRKKEFSFGSWIQMWLWLLCLCKNICSTKLLFFSHYFFFYYFFHSIISHITHTLTHTHTWAVVWLICRTVNKVNKRKKRRKRSKFIQQNDY